MQQERNTTTPERSLYPVDNNSQRFFLEKCLAKKPLINQTYSDNALLFVVLMFLIVVSAGVCQQAPVISQEIQRVGQDTVEALIWTASK